MKRRSATVYERRGVYYVVSSDLATEGYFTYGRHHVVPGTATPEELARVVVQAVEESHEVRIPARSAVSEAPLYTAAGAGTFRAFVEGTRAVTVYQRGDEVIVRPNTNAGAKKGFEPRVGRERRVALTVTDLEKAVQEALAECD